MTARQVPAPHHEIARQLVSIRELRERSSDDVRALLGRVDAAALTTWLERERLLPLVGTRLADLLDAGDVPPIVLHRAEEALRAADARGNVHELITLQVATTLEGAGIRAVPLKGAVLSRALYGSPGYRLSADIDVLVAPQRLHDAVQVLGRLGHRELRPRPAGRSLPLLHVEVSPGESAPTIEVHWRIHWYERDWAAAALARARTGPDGLRRMAPSDEIAALLLFHARDGFAGLRLAADIAAWWDVHAADLPERPLEPIVDAHPELERALATSARAAARVVGVPYERLLRPDRPYSSLALRLIDLDSSSDPAQTAADAALVDLLLAPRGTARDYVRRQLLVPAAGHPPRTRMAQGEHAARLIRRMLLALGRLRASRHEVHPPPCDRGGAVPSSRR